MQRLTGRHTRPFDRYKPLISVRFCKALSCCPRSAMAPAVIAAMEENGYQEQLFEGGGAQA